MAREILSCPYCNSSISLSVPSPMGQRISCPRCQETFPYRPGEQVDDEIEESWAHKLDNEPAAGERWSNAAVALAILAGMVTMAVLALTFAELTVQLRRSHDIALPGRRSFTLPAVALGAMLVYVVALAIYVGKLLGGRERPLRGLARAGATGFFILLVLIGLAEIYGIARRFRTGQAAAASGRGDPESISTTPAAPAELAALAYLPSDTNVLLGLQVREALQQPLGQEIVERWQAGPGDATLAGMVRSAGLELADVDHVVVGLKVDDSLLPRVRIIVRTQKPYDPEGLRAALKVGRPATRLEKTLYRFGVPQTALEAVVWFGDERTFVFALAPEDLDDVPLQPGEGLARLAAPLQQALGEMKNGTLLWLAGHSSDWQKSVLAMPFLQVPKTMQALLKQVKTFAAWLELTDKANLQLALGCADRDAATQVNDCLTRQGVEPGKPLPFFEQRWATSELGEELGQSLQRSQKEEWVHLSASATPEGVRRALDGGVR
jgi:hypothetical protein